MNKTVRKNVQEIVDSRDDLLAELISVILLWIIGVGILSLASPLLLTIDYSTFNNLLSVVAPVIIFPLGGFLTILFWRKHRYDTALFISFMALILILLSIANLQVRAGV